MFLEIRLTAKLSLRFLIQLADFGILMLHR